jgi:tol-pal system protein YbgF
MRYIKINDTLFLTEQEVVKKGAKEVKVAKGLNHIFIYDRSGSMYGLLDTLISDLKTRLRTVPVGDTVTIGYFSSPGEFRFPLKGLKISGKGDYASTVSRIESRLDDLENNMRQLTGRIEEATHQNQQTQKQLEKYMADAELRFQTLEQFKTQMTPVTPPPGAQTLPANPTSQTTIPPQPIVPGKPAATTAPVTPPAPTPPVGTAQENYDAALALLHQTDYAGAEAKFKDFLKAFPQDTLAGNAQYWLAETYYVRGSYNDSAVEFLKSYQSYPKSNKAPDSLLKLGLSLSQLNNKAEACTTLKKLDKEYPKAVAAIKKRAVDEMSKLKCG